MKVYFLISFSLLFCYTGLFAQDLQKAKKADPIVWCGIDFTRAKFVRITETAQQVKDVLEPINNLIPSEPNKYNISKYFEKQTVLISLTTVQKRNEGINPSKLLAADPITLTRDDIQEVVSAYAGVSNKAATGLIFVVENCDKSALQASIYVCFFDIGTGKIIYMAKDEGKPRGFGLRNYWAGAVYQVMKNWTY